MIWKLALIVIIAISPAGCGYKGIYGSKIGPITGKEYDYDWNIRSYPNEYYKEFKQQYIDAEGIEEPYASDILGSKIRIGMTTEMVRHSWGKPENINTSVNQYGTTEQWVYEYGSYERRNLKRNYLYFDDDILQSYQFNK